MAQVLILGGTRNLGHVTALSLLESGHDVAILNRGRTPDELPAEIERIRADREDESTMRSAIGSRSFDLVLDNTTYTKADALQAVKIFRARVGRYVFISSGQVYLVRENLSRPFREADYAGTVMPEPPRDSADHASWLYGVDKRNAEEVFKAAAKDSQFPVTVLRLPMVASERDHYGRIQAYIARILDGGPLLLPAERGLPLRHVYVGDVARLVTGLASNDAGIGEAYNVSCGESVTLEEFIELLSRTLERTPQIIRAPRATLDSAKLLPDCSPFSGRWMSELDNTESIRALTSVGLRYSPPADYLPAIAEDYVARWIANGKVPDGYGQRTAELTF
ncbi:MAG: NAD-dependent epimerase/dehydratase family protein [Gemmatimonadales bacterium]